MFRMRQEPQKAVSYIRLRRGSAMIFLPGIDDPSTRIKHLWNGVVLF